MKFATAFALSPACRFTPAPLLPRYCTSLINRSADLWWETLLGVNTVGDAGPSKFADGYHYGTLAYHTYFSIFDWLDVGPADVVVDLGAGKGRVTCIAALYPVKRVVGVEIDPGLCSMGRHNAEEMRRRVAPIDYVCQSATEFDFDEATVITLFNPFGTDTMNEVLERLQASVARNPREVRIAYGNPILSPMLAAKPWLEAYEFWTPGTWSRLKFPVHFYRTL